MVESQGQGHLKGRGKARKRALRTRDRLRRRQQNRPDSTGASSCCMLCRRGGCTDQSPTRRRISRRSRT